MRLAFRKAALFYSSVKVYERIILTTTSPGLSIILQFILIHSLLYIYYIYVYV